MDLQARVAKGPILTDGAWGTELQARGLAPGDCPDLWNITHEPLVAEVARSYVEAGSEVILTNTFRSNAISLGNFAGRAEEFSRAGAAISRKAAGDSVLVFGSIGPVGEVRAGGEDLRDRTIEAFTRQARALAEGGVDAILIETMSDVDEAAIALEAARTTGLPVIVSFAFTDAGATPEQAAAAMTQAGATAVGTNCADIESAIGICRRLRAATGLPVWLKPNAGLPRMNGGSLVYDVTAEDFAARVPDMVDAGAAFIGACCGSGPDFIAAARRKLSASR